MRKEGDETGTLKPETIQKAKDQILATKAKVEATFARNTPDRVAADKYIKALYGFVKMLETPAMNVLLAGVEKHPDASLGDLMQFMANFNLRFGAAQTPQQKEAYRLIYGMLIQLRSDIVPSQGSTDPQPPAAGFEAPVAAFDKMNFDQIDGKPASSGSFPQVREKAPLGSSPRRRPAGLPSVCRWPSAGPSANAVRRPETPLMARRLLLVQDSSIMRRMISALLEDEGYEVALAVDGREGLARARESAARTDPDRLRDARDGRPGLLPGAESRSRPPADPGADAHHPRGDREQGARSECRGRRLHAKAAVAPGGPGSLCPSAASFGSPI